jgi:hypothetical protein
MTSPTIRRPLALNALTGARSVLGVLALFLPRTGARMFRIDADETPAIVMGRLFGIRNIALAAGLLRLDASIAPRQMIVVNMLIDVVDAGAFVAAGRRREIGAPATVIGAVLALTGAAFGAIVLAAQPGCGR